MQCRRQIKALSHSRTIHSQMQNQWIKQEALQSTVWMTWQWMTQEAVVWSSATLMTTRFHPKNPNSQPPWRKDRRRKDNYNSLEKKRKSKSLSRRQLWLSRVICLTKKSHRWQALKLGQTIKLSQECPSSKSITLSPSRWTNNSKLRSRKQRSTSLK